jgi:hypothetical protein
MAIVHMDLCPGELIKNEVLFVDMIETVVVIFNLSLGIYYKIFHFTMEKSFYMFTQPLPQNLTAGLSLLSN